MPNYYLFINYLLSICVLTVVFELSAFAQGGNPKPIAPSPVATPSPPLSYPDYKTAMQAGEKFLNEKAPESALKAYQSAFNLAATDPERAAALFGAGKARQNITKPVTIQENGKRVSVQLPDQNLTTDEYKKIVKLLGISDDVRLEAYQTMADFYVSQKNPFGAIVAYGDIIRTLPNLPTAKRVEVLFKKVEVNPLSDGAQFQWAFSDLQEILKISEATEEQKARALLVMAGLQQRVKQIQPAFQNYARVIQMPGAKPEQKAMATLYSGKLLWENNEIEKAREMISKVITLPDVAASYKVQAYTMLAESYRLQKNPGQQQAELTKITTLAGASDQEKAAAHYLIAGLLAEAGNYPAARAEMQKIISLKEAKNEYIAGAHFHTGNFFEKEKNLKKARESWNKMLTTAENDSLKEDAFKAITASYMAEKNYSAARAAALQRVALPAITKVEKQQALVDLGDVYAAEKNLLKARETYRQAAELEGGEADTKHKALLGVLNSYKNDKDLTALSEAYAALAAFIASDTKLKPDVRKQQQQEIWEVADAYAGDDKTMAFALPIYQALIGGGNAYILDTANRGKLALGDIFYRQKKYADAKAMLQKVSVGVFKDNQPLNQQLALAQEKIKLIESEEQKEN